MMLAKIDTLVNDQRLPNRQLERSALKCSHPAEGVALGALSQGVEVYSDLPAEGRSLLAI